MTWTSEAYIKNFMGFDNDEAIRQDVLDNVVENEGEGPFGFTKMDAVEHYTYLLKALNDVVSARQREYFAKQDKLDKLDEERLKRKNPRSRAEFLGYFIIDKTQEQFSGVATEATKHVSALANKVIVAADTAVQQVFSANDNSTVTDLQEGDGALSGAERVARILRNSEARVTMSSPLHDKRPVISSEAGALTGLDIVDEDLEDNFDDADAFFSALEDDTAEHRGFVDDIRLVGKYGNDLLKAAAKGANVGAKGVVKESVHAAKIVGTGALKGIISTTICIIFSSFAM
jgi:hypothetical protein